MSEIEVPYLPISEFDPNDVLQKLEGTGNDEEREKSPEKTEEKDNLQTKTDSSEEELSNESSDDDDELGKFDFDDDSNLKKTKITNDVDLVIVGMGMEKYLPLFKAKNLQLETITGVTERDLEELGIKNAEDRKLICQNLNFVKKQTESSSDSQMDDFNILRNLTNQFQLLYSYAAYVDLQLKKVKFVDYKVTQSESAGTFLKAFVKTIIQQNQLLQKELYNVQGEDSLLDLVVKGNKMTFPESLQVRIPKKRKGLFRRGTFKVILLVGLSSLLLYTGKHAIKKFRIL